MGLWTVLALFMVFLCVNGDAAHVLVHKTVESNLEGGYFVEGMNFSIKYNLYNIETNPAMNIVLNDKLDDLEVLGEMPHTIETIGSESDVEYVITVIAKAGALVLDRAEYSYKDFSGGDVIVLSHAAYMKKIDKHYVDWLAYVSGMLVLICVPGFIFYSISKISGKNVAKPHSKRE